MLGGRRAGTPRYLEKLQRVQVLLIGRVASRLGLPPDDARPAAIVGSAFACLQAARGAWLASEQSEPFPRFLDRVMSTFTIHSA